MIVNTLLPVSAPCKPPEPDATLAKKLLTWFDQYGRHNLPWQLPRTPYRVWVSEIMLQQTQVATATPYFNAFMQHFPTLQALAESPLDDVLLRWAGLGYYARARNLHKAAQIVMHDHNGELPATLAALMALPGIGRSTAGAILAMGYHVRAAILDGNVKRVLCRVAALQEWPGRPGPARMLWALAERHTPVERVCDYTQALMDLGATLCTRSRPACERCPLQDICQAFRLDLAAELPVRKPGKAIPTRHRFVFIRLRESGRIYLEQRAPTGIWGGLWSLPESDADTTLEDATHLALAKGWLPNDSVFEYRPAFRHTFSHYHLVLQPLIINEAVSEIQVQERGGDWFEVSEASLPALPAPIKKWLLQADFGLQQSTTLNSEK